MDKVDYGIQMDRRILELILHASTEYLYLFLAPAKNA